MTTTADIQLFVKVVGHGSFSETARALSTTPSSVSRQISALEKRLGGRLFKRTTRKQSLTEAGKIYFEHAQKLVNDIEAAEQAVKQLTDTPSGILRVTTTADFANIFIEPLLPKFLETYPDIQVNLHISIDLKDLVGENFDLAIRIGHLEDSNLFARLLSSSRSVVCASNAYLEKYGEPKHPNELTLHNCMSFRTEARSNYWRFETINGEISVPINGRFNVNSLMFLRNSVLADMGIAMIPKWMVQEDLERTRIRQILENFPLNPPSTPISAVFAHNQQLAPKVRVFIDFLSQHIKAL